MKRVKELILATGIMWMPIVASFIAENLINLF